MATIERIYSTHSIAFALISAREQTMKGLKL